MTMLAALQTLLHRWTGQDEILMGADIANRHHREVESLIGFFVNILVFRGDMSGNPKFSELLARVREATLGAYAHQDLPFEKLVAELRPERNMSNIPLVQVLFVFQNVPDQMMNLSGLTLTSLPVEATPSRFDLTLFIAEAERGVVGTWRYNTDLFEAETINRLTSHFETLLTSIAARPDARLNELEILTEAERRQKDMQKKERQEAEIKKLITVRRKAVSLSQTQLITTGYLREGESLPLVISPAAPDLDLADWAGNNREFLSKELLKHGAILFRGFNVDSVTEFERVALAIGPDLFGDYGDLPREEVSSKVYGSTTYPQDKAILFHNESSHMHRWPLKIWFYCVKAAQQGGETPIVDCRKVYQLLAPEIKDRFAQKKIAYVRNFTEVLDVSWQEFFRTADRAVVEAYCRDAGMDFEWKGQAGLKIRKTCPAVIRHPKTGEMSFFNQIQLHHVACLGSALYSSLISSFTEQDLPRNVYYGDGSAIEDDVIESIGEIYRNNSVSFPWREGDILMLDNMLTAHSRNPYTGPRKIVVAMGEIVRQQEI